MKRVISIPTRKPTTGYIEPRAKEIITKKTIANSKKTILNEKQSPKNIAIPEVIRIHSLSFDSSSFFPSSVPIAHMVRSKKTFEASANLELFTRGRMLFSIKSLASTSGISHSSPYPVIIRIFFSSVAITRRIPLFFPF